MTLTNWKEVEMVWKGGDGSKELYVKLPGESWKHCSAIAPMVSSLFPSYAPGVVISRGWATFQALHKLGATLLSTESTRIDCEPAEEKLQSGVITQELEAMSRTREMLSKILS
jgi:hypothetical protein